MRSFMHSLYLSCYGIVFPTLSMPRAENWNKKAKSSTTCNQLLAAIGLSLMLLGILGCPSDTPDESSAIERGTRIIGYDILDFTESGDFTSNHETASGELYGEFIQLLQPWNAFEDVQADVWDGDAMVWYETLNDFTDLTGTKLSLIITPIDIPGRFVPAYLMNKKFDDQNVIDSFIALLDRLFNEENGIVDPANVIALSVGNEIDHYNWSANDDDVSEFKVFLEAIKPTLNSYGIPLHFTGTLYGLTQTGTIWTDLAESVDRVSVTYYPINNDFTVKEPQVALTDVQNLTTKFASKDLFFQEVGYPSSSTLLSSENNQAAFFTNFFAAWDAHKDQIRYASILRLNDVSMASAQDTAITYGVAGNENFIEYIRTLGIRTWEETGTNKKAFEAIQDALILRSW